MFARYFIFVVLEIAFFAKISFLGEAVMSGDYILAALADYFLY